MTIARQAYRNALARRGMANGNGGLYSLINGAPPNQALQRTAGRDRLQAILLADYSRPTASTGRGPPSTPI